jgi:hypothetical protein
MTQREGRDRYGRDWRWVQMAAGRAGSRGPAANGCGNLAGRIRRHRVRTTRRSARPVRDRQHHQDVRSRRRHRFLLRAPYRTRRYGRTREPSRAGNVRRDRNDRHLRPEDHLRLLARQDRRSRLVAIVSQQENSRVYGMALEGEVPPFQPFGRVRGRHVLGQQDLARTCLRREMGRDVRDIA